MNVCPAGSLGIAVVIECTVCYRTVRSACSVKCDIIIVFNFYIFKHEICIT